MRLRAATLMTVSVCGSIVAVPAWSEASCWKVMAPSELGFEAVQAASPFKGRFGDFRAIVRFDPKALTSSVFDVEIDTNSVDTDYEDRDDILRGPEFFDVARYPRARYRAVLFERLGDERFAATGQLSIRGESREVRVTFSFASEANGSLRILTGQAILNRLDFGLGRGEWGDPKWLGHEVKVRFELLLEPAVCLQESAGGA